MDVFHKVLTRINEITGGRETHEVDFIELLKTEGFFANRDSIKDHLSTEGWITDAARPNHVRITHWGVAEAKKASAGTSSDGKDIGRQITLLQSAARDLTAALETFSAKPTAKGLKPAEDRLSEIGELINKIKKDL
jgi:hypothetical protein